MEHIQHNQAIIAHWLAWSLLLRRSQFPIQAKERIINSKSKGIIDLILNCDMVYSIHVQHLVQVNHTHP